MKRIRELEVFIKHYDWPYKDENEYFVPTDKAPQKAVEAMKKVNAMLKFDRDNKWHII